MIEQKRGVWIATCDGGCGRQTNTGLKSFQQAVNFISRAEGWRNEKLRGVWTNYCPDCAESADDLGIVGVGFTRKHIPDDDE